MNMHRSRPHSNQRPAMSVYPAGPAPMGAPVHPNIAPMGSPASGGGAILALREGRIGEGIKKILYDRLSLSGAQALASVTYNMFNSHTKAANPESTNMLEAARMGPMEAFVIQGLGICINVNSTEEGLVKFLQEARLRIGVGPDDVEKLSLPLIFLPTPAGVSLSASVDLTAKTPAGFYLLNGEQEINLTKGQPFSARIIQGSYASALAAGEVVDVFVQLFGTYHQQVIRG